MRTFRLVLQEQPSEVPLLNRLLVLQSVARRNGLPVVALAAAGPGDVPAELAALAASLQAGLLSCSARQAARDLLRDHDPAFVRALCNELQAALAPRGRKGEGRC